MFLWNAEMIRYQQQEYENRGLYAPLADAILSRTSGSILDAGCGLGFLSEAFQGRGRFITSLDSVPLPVTSVKLTCADIHAFHPETPYGTMVCCNFGSLLEDLALASVLCSGTLVIVRKDWENHRFSKGRTALRSNPADSTARLLASLALPYDTASVVIHAGPRFKDQRDANAFFALYGSPDVAPSLVSSEGGLFLPMDYRYRCFFIKVSTLPSFASLTDLVIIGERGVGKSTLVDGLLSGRTGGTGFRTKKVDGVVYLNPIGETQYTPERQVGTCAEHRGFGLGTAFDTWGCDCLSRPGRWRLMDEVGFLENDALRFQDGVLAGLSDPLPTICVTKTKASLFLEKVRRHPSALALVLDTSNRDDWREELKRAIPVTQEWLFAKRLSAAFSC